MTTRPRKATPAKAEAAPETVAGATEPRPQSVTIKRRVPELPAYFYDGTNAVAVASWVNQQGGSCQISFPSGNNALPQLIGQDGQPVPSEVYVLPTLEVITFADMDAQYDIVTVLV
jgi:hypothetical protein